jgi:hypothetical protein
MKYLFFIGIVIIGKSNTCQNDVHQKNRLELAIVNGDTVTSSNDLVFDIKLFLIKEVRASKRSLSVSYERNRFFDYYFFIQKKEGGRFNNLSMSGRQENLYPPDPEPTILIKQQHFRYNIAPLFTFPKGDYRIKFVFHGSRNNKISDVHSRWVYFKILQEINSD